jgi:hypothetical protein
MDLVAVLQSLPRFRELHRTKRNTRNPREEVEYREMLKNPQLAKIPLVEEYQYLLTTPNPSSVQRAALAQFEINHKDIVTAYGNLMRRGKGRRRLTRRRRTTRKRR